MAILALEVLITWFVVALATGCALGSIIHKADAIRRDQVLAAAFARVARVQAPPAAAGQIDRSGQREVALAASAHGV